MRLSLQETNRDFGNWSFQLMLKCFAKDGNTFLGYWDCHNFRLIFESFLEAFLS